MFSIKIELSSELGGAGFEYHRTSEASKGCSLNVRETEGQFGRGTTERYRRAWYV
jgi:hypothetical protein